MWITKTDKLGKIGKRVWVDYFGRIFCAFCTVCLFESADGGDTRLWWSTGIFESRGYKWREKCMAVGHALAALEHQIWIIPVYHNQSFSSYPQILHSRGGRHSWCGRGLRCLEGYAEKNRVSPPVLSEPDATQRGELSTAARSLERDRVFCAYPSKPLLIPSLHHESATFYWNIFRKVLQWTIKLKSGTMSLRQTFLIDTKEYESDVWQE